MTGDQHPRIHPTADWAGPDGELGAYIVEEAEKTLDAFRFQPNLVDEQASHEEDTARGGYAHRQLFELIQNSADALAGAPDSGKIAIRLTENHLYCVDDGNPIDRDGVRALMFSRLSPKRGASEIGRHGLGFKSVLGVSDAPEFFSRSGSFRFDRERAAARIRKVVAGAERYPALRTPEPIDPREYCDQDGVLDEFMRWARNIVRLPLKPGAYEDLERQMLDFPPEFLLFVKHVSRLTLTGEALELDRKLELQRVDDEYLLADGDKTAQWKVFERTHQLSGDARADRRPRDDGDEVPIWWAAPLDRLNDSRNFWAFFPTKTASLVAGILNAPWKTNEDRQNLLSGPYNDELIESAAELIADTLPGLATQADPARHLDALPRRHEAGDTEQSDGLRGHLFANLHERQAVPDQVGDLRATQEILYPPKELTPDRQIALAPFERWAAYPGRPSNWLHHKALTRNRLSTIDRLHHPRDESPSWHQDGAPRASIAKWLTALTEGQRAGDAVEASKAAIQTAALIPPDIRQGQHLGKIVLTRHGGWRALDPATLFLPDESLERVDAAGGDRFVHADLASDTDTLAALREFGLGPASPESQFKLIVESTLSGPSEDDTQDALWTHARKVAGSALAIIQGVPNWNKHLRVRTQSGAWRPLYSVLLPGDIVPGDGSRDSRVTIDLDFHESDTGLLRALGATDAPNDDHDLSPENWYSHFLDMARRSFIERDLRQKPRDHLLNFVSTTGSGPLEVLFDLTDKGKALYTDALLSLDATYDQWIMKHATRAYPEMLYESPADLMLRKDGRIRTPDGIALFEDALGSQPKNPAALHALLEHPKAERIKETFGLADPLPEFIGEEAAIPFIDVWPGIEEHLGITQRTCQLIRCERIIMGARDPECIFHAPNIYLVSTSHERDELRLVSNELGLGLNDRQIEGILQYETKKAIEEERAAIRELSTDPERLLAAVGEQTLRQDLPDSLLAILENDGVPLTGLDLAEAAIATYHFGALRQYRRALDRLDPPKQWAGSARAINFVHSLGFSDEWAGERKKRRDPFLEVEGAYSLPELHDYQKTIVAKVRDMLRNGRVDGAKRRGMISMPTGSGKTRVAVQAVVEAMRDDGFNSGILWVADRDELCEQAVEAWQQVWSSIGAHESVLRISRMWGEQRRPPLPTSELHVVIATIQTLYAKFSNQPREYEFLADFTLVVFDEAHRSVAPTFTSVMQEIGLTRWQRKDEPFLLGLTATPYRGHYVEETARLVNRYGSNRLDAGAFDSDDPEAVIHELQDMDVLARVDHETIEGGSFSLNADELTKMNTKLRPPWLPQSVQDRIARDSERTKRIIEAYVHSVDPDWPTLIFATSVEHAQTVAALLNSKGVKSRAVSGETEPSTRRSVVREFRSGEIKALVNYGVFREGFDAPTTRAIIVARPVYSPNLYFQMIGRGLRGVKNGGSDRCLILNVEDNIENFQRALAFSELDGLWA